MSDDATDQEDRTEEATPQRHEQARERGQIPRSRELTAALTLLGGAAVLHLTGESVARATGLLSTEVFGHLDRARDPFGLLFPSLQGLGYSLVPFFAVTTLATVLGTLFQTGVPHAEWMVPDFGRANPLPRLAQLFQPSLGGWELIKTLCKIGGVGYAAFHLLYPVWHELADHAALGPAAMIARLLSLSGSLTMRLGFLLLCLALLDYVVARMRVEKQLRMSKREVREELRHSEGNPQIKRRLRKKAREILRRRLAVDVPKADVVVVNPTHFAVALSYKAQSMRAPRVTAKGADHLALRIRELARAAQVPVVSNPPLARDLYRRVKLGAEVPGDLYKAVAEVLAFVYRIRNRVVLPERRAGRAPGRAQRNVPREVPGAAAQSEEGTLS